MTHKSLKYQRAKLKRFEMIRRNKQTGHVGVLFILNACFWQRFVSPVFNSTCHQHRHLPFYGQDISTTLPPQNLGLWEGPLSKQRLIKKQMGLSTLLHIIWHEATVRACSVVSPRGGDSLEDQTEPARHHVPLLAVPELHRGWEMWYWGTRWQAH